MRTGKIYHPQVIFEECKYNVKEKKIPKYVTDDIQISSDCDWEDSKEENSGEENFDEGNSNKENSDEQN